MQSFFTSAVTTRPSWSCFDFPIPAVNAIGLCFERIAVPAYPAFSALAKRLYFHSFNSVDISGGPGFFSDVLVSSISVRMRIVDISKIYLVNR